MVAAIQTMRIVALPLTRPSAHIHRLTNGQLNRYTYYLIQAPNSKEPSSLDREKTDGGSPAHEKRWLPKEGVVNWTTQKAVDLWTGFGKAEGGWRLKTYKVGQGIMDRTEFEEQALKNFDPSVALTPEQAEQDHQPIKVQLLYPPSILSPIAALADLRSFVDVRIPQHRKGFFLWMSVIPFTAPFKLIPIIPNLPFFFSAWRSWSHYKANKTAKYLRTLLDHNFIEPQANEGLDRAYKAFQLSSPTTHVPPSTESLNFSSKFDFVNLSSPDPQDVLILNRDAIPLILSALDVPDDTKLSNDLYRALDQTVKRISIKP